MVKRIIILGSTGSIGTSSLDVIAANDGRFRAVGLTANRSVDLMHRQVRQCSPQAVAMRDPEAASELRRRLDGAVPVYEGEAGIDAMIRDLDADAVVNGLVGSAGMRPTLEALETGKDVLLANKETMVMAGELVMETAERTGRRIVPIDSEMSAIYQCLKGEDPAHVRRLILTASGGPFVDATAGELSRVTLEQALDHPTWSMGTKNTIDSATLMNKGLEVIEASRLFRIPGDRIDVAIHRSSVVHSFVEYIDGSVLAQLSEPDMKLAIQYAMTDPERLPSCWGGLDFTKPFSLAFEPPDPGRFPCLSIAYDALARGGTATAAVNGANEQAVSAFVSGDITFASIPDLIRTVLDDHRYIESPGIEELIATDLDAKRHINTLCGA